MGVCCGAVLDSRTCFDAVDRSPLFVRPIDRHREGALAQPSQRCARGVRKPPRRIDQFVDGRAAIPLKQFDDLRELRPAARSGGARGRSLVRSTPDQRPHFKEGAKSLVARTTARKTGERLRVRRWAPGCCCGMRSTTNRSKHRRRFRSRPGIDSAGGDADYCCS